MESLQFISQFSLLFTNKFIIYNISFFFIFFVLLDQDQGHTVEILEETVDKT